VVHYAGKSDTAEQVVTEIRKAIIEKGHKFESMVEKVHGCTTSAPLVAGNTIAFTLTMDVTMKGRGRVKLEEICAYEVKDGKIVSEQFFM
jgi:hypothetical protein